MWKGDREDGPEYNPWGTTRSKERCVELAVVINLCELLERRHVGFRVIQVKYPY